MKSNLRMREGNAPDASAGPGFEGRILRLVKGGAERRAIEAGEVDAILDPATGVVLLLPEAQAALRGDEARLRSLLALTADWRWVQDEFYRFVSHTGIVSGESGIYDESAIGKTLRDPPFDGMSDADWQAHRRQLDWRATFRDFELRCMDRAGEMRWVSVSGEPTFDELDQFTGYRGTMRDITLRKWTETLAQKPIRLASDTLDALAVEVCVLDSTGMVIMANKSSQCSPPGRGSIGAGVPVGTNYLDVCDKAGGNERADGIAIAAGIRRVIAGDGLLFRHEYAWDSPEGRCWFNLTVTAFPGEGAARVVVSRENAGASRRVEPIPGDGAGRGSGLTQK
jgi:PAS domain S-box-containing protein